MHETHINNSRDYYYLREDVMPEITYLNGQYCTIQEASVPVNDRGYQFGDGVYEVVRSYSGTLWELEGHLKRLERSLKEIGLTGIDTEHVKKSIEGAYAESSIQNALVYIQVTRGIQTRDHMWNDGLEPSLLITVRELKEIPEETYASGVHVITMPENRWMRRDIKSLNLLGNCLALKEAQRQGALEPVYIENGYVTEAASASLFIAKQGVVITREPGPHILSGITQKLVLEIAREMNIPVEERPFTSEEFFSADEAFLTATTFAVLGIRTADSETIGSSCPGETTSRIRNAYMEKVQSICKNHNVD